MDEVIRNIVVVSGLICLGVFANLSPYWNKHLFAIATEKQTKKDPKMPTNLEERQRYVSRMLFKATSIFYLIMVFVLIWNVVTLIRILVG